MMLSIFFLAIFSLSQALASQAQDSVGSTNASLLWGPYRPNLYLGIRPRIPESLLMGLMWSRADQAALIEKNLRHTCEQDEGMDGYGWTFYDIRNGGSQIINDKGNNVDLVTQFVKSNEQNPGQWGLRVRGYLRADAPDNQQTTVVFYLGGEEALSKIECKKRNYPNPPHSDVKCKGVTFNMGEFALDLRSLTKIGSLPRKIAANSLNVPAGAIWRAKSFFLRELKKGGESEGMIANKPGRGNLHFIQMTFEGEFEFDIFFSSDPVSETMTSARLSELIKETHSTFKDQFDSTYQPRSPFDSEQYSRFSQSLLSNLMGGIGYFHGTSTVNPNPALADLENEEYFWMKAELAQSNADAEERGPHQLYTAVASRPFFPRGFSWDEGFHLQVILEWDMDLALEIVSSWFNLMDENGWIAREQILGPEARSKVPPQFLVQYPHYANPPTLFLVVQAFVEKLQGLSPYSGHRSENLDNPSIGREYLMAIYPKLKKNYEWFCRTQSGNLTSYQVSGSQYKHGYRWRGRTPEHTLTSGLDDYPRPQPPHPEELHIDALSWVGAMTIALEKISGVLAQNEDNVSFSKHKADIMQSIDGIHWSQSQRAYCDVTVAKKPLVAHFCHKGYLSLFPFLTGLMGPEHPHLEAVLNLIRNPGELWSSFGVRSLSRNDRYYGADENYWRSPVWININYMIVQQLLTLSAQPGPLQSKMKNIYDELRVILVNTVYQSWKETGFAWEQYNPDNGKGQRTQHFTGWTALIVKIMAFPELKHDGRPLLSIPKLQVGVEGVHGSHSITSIALFMGILLGCVAYRRRLMLMLAKLQERYLTTSRGRS